MRRRADQQRSFKTCDAPGCAEKIRRGMLLCRPHWFALPRELRQAISATWAARAKSGLAPWSANVLEARRYLANNTPAALAARITGEN